MSFKIISREQTALAAAPRNTSGLQPMQSSLSTGLAQPHSFSCFQVLALQFFHCFLHSVIVPVGGAGKTHYKPWDLDWEPGSSYCTVNKLPEDVLCLSFALKNTSLCAPRLVHTVSQSIAKGDKDICFEGALLAQKKPLAQKYPAETL